MHDISRLRTRIVLAVAAALSACSSQSYRMTANGDGLDGGVPLAQLSTIGPAPQAVRVTGVDRVVVREGAGFAVTADGPAEALAALRFVLADGSLAIGRAPGTYRDGPATITVTAPPLRMLSANGSATIEAARLAPEGTISLSGSSRAKLDPLAGDTLAIAFSGSSEIEAAGRVRALDLEANGSARATLLALTVQAARLRMSGASHARLTATGAVTGSLSGAAKADIAGGAPCQVSTSGVARIACAGG